MMNCSNEKVACIALGGNALGNDPNEMLNLVKCTAENIVDIVESGARVVICHGNGPQVGMIANAFGIASAKNHDVSDMPFAECGAMSQGYIGYQLSQAIKNELNKRNINKGVACVVTQTLVDKDDPAFADPTKPVGSFYDEDEAKRKMEASNLIFKEDSGRGWRQVVASPKPQKIIEMEIIKKLINEDNIVIAGGGGGVPVVLEENKLCGVPAVIDKDKTAAKIATEINANCLLILTAVEHVAINFNKPNQQDLDVITTNEAYKFIEEGQFAAGSMLPKVEACIQYLQENNGGEAIITSLQKAEDGIKGTTGTRIIL